MKRLLFIILLFPCIIHGQVDLCHDCAIKIYDVDAVLKKKCCEKCLQEFYIRQLRKNITHGNLSQYYEEFDSWSSFIDFPESLSAHFLVTDITPNIGYCLTDSGLIERKKYYLVNLECQDSVVQSGTAFILIVDDSSSFNIGHIYYMKLHPYFKKNQSFRIVGDKLYTVVSGNRTLFDLVYKKWLLTMLPVGQNYFFLHSETPM